jgi:hypothetical protein
LVAEARFVVTSEALSERTVLVRVEGEIDMATTPELADCLLRAAEGGSTALTRLFAVVDSVGAAREKLA